MKKKIALTGFLVAMITVWQCTLLAQDTWQQISPTGDIPSDREGYTMVTIDGLVYLFGGKDTKKSSKSISGSFDTMHIYLPSTQEWMEEETINTPPPARSGH